MNRAALATLSVIAGMVAVISDDAYIERKQERAIVTDREGAYAADADRNVFDLGVVFHVVERDPNGEELIRGKPRLRVISKHRSGWIFDRRESASEDRPSANPLTWYVSRAQWEILSHDVDGVEPSQLVEGSEGSGKTTLLAMWHYRMWLRHLREGREGLQTAPTNARLGGIVSEIKNLWRPEWYRQVNRKEFVGFELCDGSSIRTLSTHRASEAEGSRIQTFNSSWAGEDEKQDSLDTHDDVTARGRAARNNVYPRLGTATMKDSPAYRTLRETMRSAGGWKLRRLLIAESPFVHADFLETARRSGISDREFRRRFGAEDLPPERMLYFGWKRAADGRRLNVRPVPVLGARRITSIVLARKTGNRAHDLLVGNDPGTAKCASVWLDAFEIRGEPDPVWWVRGELFTRHESTEAHARKVLDRVRDRHGCNKGRVVNGQWTGPREIAHVRAQPVGQAIDKPDLDVYRIWTRVGFDIKAAQYKKDGTGTGHIAKDSRVEMVNSLLCDAVERRRLYIDCDEHGRPVAPKLVEAFETMERDEKGRAETEAKDEDDMSDVPAALGYALWPWEKEAATNLRADLRKGRA